MSMGEKKAVRTSKTVIVKSHYHGGVGSESTKTGGAYQRIDIMDVDHVGPKVDCFGELITVSLSQGQHRESGLEFPYV